jgi:DNA-binding transcriptional regulator YdaS (Cro superfamily)
MIASALNVLGGSIAAMSTLSERIKEAMGKMTKADLARAADVTPASVTFWLDGSTKQLSAQNALLLSRATATSTTRRA